MSTENLIELLEIVGRDQIIVDRINMLYQAKLEPYLAPVINDLAEQRIEADAAGDTLGAAVAKNTTNG